MDGIIASHTIKPTSPTPLERKTHRLSSLDQIALPVYIPLIFFYENKQYQADISRCLRQSLSETLTIFYPLAGEIKHNSFVDCSDRGAEFVEARLHARLNHFTQNPTIDDLKQLVTRESSSHRDDIILSVKITFFDCGGVALGVCLSHKIADAASMTAFMNAWAASCRGEHSRIIHPSFDLALHFPPLNIEPSEFWITKERIETKRLVLEKEKVEELRKLWSNEVVKDPSRVEAISALIWKSFIDAERVNYSSFVASHMVNLRPRTVPPMADHSFGNCFFPTSAVVSSSKEEGDFLVSKLRAAIRGVGRDFIDGIAKGERFSASAGEFLMEGGCSFTSWLRFPVYDVDFGWGKPVWVGTTPMPLMNLVVLMDTNPSKEGIEFWVNTAHQSPVPACLMNMMM